MVYEQDIMIMIIMIIGTIDERKHGASSIRWFSHIVSRVGDFRINALASEARRSLLITIAALRKMHFSGFQACSQFLIFGPKTIQA